MKKEFAPLEISLIYAIIGGTWVLLSDKLLEMAVKDPVILTRIETLKGWFFITCTALLLYYLINRRLKQLKRSQNELNEREGFYRIILEGTTDGMWDWHIGTDYLLASPGLMEKLGYEPEYLGNSLDAWFTLMHPVDAEHVKSYIKEYLENKHSQYRVEYRLRQSSGEYIWILSRGQTVLDENGKPVRIIGTHTDVTERKTSEETLRKAMEENTRLLNEAIKYDELKTELFNNISHEFRTPLNLILGSIQLIEVYSSRDDLDIKPENLLRYTRIMKQNSFRLLKLVNNLIDVSIIDSGFSQLNLGNYNIVELVENIVLSAGHYAQSKSISLIFDTDVEEKLVACDFDKIERIMLNLLSNAVKYTGEGGSISVNLFGSDDGVLIKVKDTGVGIPADKLQIIFERFRQVNASLTRENEGSGIGLFLARQLVELHGGRIWVESEEGKGSTFFVQLPGGRLREGMANSLSSHEIRRIERINVEFSDIAV